MNGVHGEVDQSSQEISEEEEQQLVIVNGRYYAERRRRGGGCEFVEWGREGGRGEGVPQLQKK